VQQRKQGRIANYAGGVEKKTGDFLKKNKWWPGIQEGWWRKKNDIKWGKEHTANWAEKIEEKKNKKVVMVECEKGGKTWGKRGELME